MRLIMKMILLHRAQPEAKPQGRRLAYDGWQEAAPSLLTAHQRDILQAEDPAVCGRPYVTQTHFAVGGEMYLPAFQIVPDVDEDAAGMTVAAAVPGAAPRPLMELAPGNGLYADVPTGKYKKDKQGDKTRWQFQYDRAVERTALGSVHPGETDIYLYDADGTMHGPVRRLVVLPSSMTATALHRMVQEILSLCRDLVALDPARRAQAKAALTFDVSGASGMPRTPDAPDAADGAAAFQQLLGRTAQALAVLAPALARIDRRPPSSPPGRATPRGCATIAPARRTPRTRSRSSSWRPRRSPAAGRPPRRRWTTRFMATYSRSSPRSSRSPCCRPPPCATSRGA